jgi:hypothetical protein
MSSLPGSSINKPGVTSSDPETGIQEWMDAVNHKDITRLYALAPDEIRQQVSYEQFVQANENNVLFSPAWEFTNYTVLNKTINQSTSSIMAMLVLQKPVSENSTRYESIPVYYTFILVYEDDQWKVWTS